MYQERVKMLFDEISALFAQAKPSFNGFNEDATILVKWLCGKLADLEGRVRFMELEMPRTVR